jgi:Polyketide cyclase / dehydrase and lipid transport
VARYTITIESTLSPPEAFAYMADFSNAVEWDPSVVKALRASDAPVGLGSTFDLVVMFGGRKLPMRYEIVSFEEPRLVVIEARKPSFTSRDTITVSPAGDGSTVHYDAVLELRGPGRMLDRVLQVLFDRTGAKASAGMRAVLAR